MAKSLEFYDGLNWVVITPEIIGAAPVLHASTATTYGVASTTNYGHVKYGTGSGTACQGNDSRLSNARTPTALVLNGAIGGHIERTNTTGLTLANAPYTILTVSQSVYDGISADIKAVLLRAYITE